MPGGTGLPKPTTHVVTFSAVGAATGAWRSCARMTADAFSGVNVACVGGQVTE